MASPQIIYPRTSLSYLQNNSKIDASRRLEAGALRLELWINLLIFLPVLEHHTIEEYWKARRYNPCRHELGAAFL